MDTEVEVPSGVSSGLFVVLPCKQEVLWVQKLKYPLVRAQGCQGIPVLKDLGVGPSSVLHALLAGRTYTSLMVIAAFQV